MKCGFSIGYSIGRKYQPIWGLVSVSDLNQNSSFGRTLGIRGARPPLGTTFLVPKVLLLKDITHMIWKNDKEIAYRMPITTLIGLMP